MRRIGGGQDSNESNLAFVMRYAMLLVLGFVSLLALMVALVATANVMAARAGRVVGDPLVPGMWALAVLAGLFLAILAKFAYVDLPTLVGDWVNKHEAEAFWLIGLILCLIVLMVI